MNKGTLDPDQLRQAIKAGKAIATLSPGQLCTIVISANPVCRLRVFGFHFDTDKCFPLPASMNGIRQIKAQYDKYAGYKVLVVGHADSRGDEGYNSNLSLERADSIHHFLMDQSAAWLAWYDSAKPESKRWGTREDQSMLSALPAKAAPYYTGALEALDHDQWNPSDEDMRKVAEKDAKSANIFDMENLEQFLGAPRWHPGRGLPPLAHQFKSAHHQIADADSVSSSGMRAVPPRR